MVIPVYNKGPHIQRSISSVLNQSYQDFELIIVNDASTDNSLEEIMKFDDPRIRVLHRDQPGPGGYAARNLGIQEARADWIAFLDADDEWYPDHLSMHEKLIVEYPDVEVCGCGYSVVDRDYGTQRKYNDSYYSARSAQGVHRLSFLEYLQAENAGLRPLWTSIATIRRNTLIEAGAFPEDKANRGGDVDTWLRCVERAGGIAWSPHIGATYFRDSVNMVTRTAYDDASKQRTTIKGLMKEQSMTERRALKVFSNHRTISAWKTNWYADPNRANFFLPTKLFWAGDIKRAITWSAFSILPNVVKTRAFRFAWAMKHSVRETISSPKSS